LNLEAQAPAAPWGVCASRFHSPSHAGRKAAERPACHRPLSVLRAQALALLRSLGTKAGSIVRIETTLNNPDRFKARRRRPSDGRLDWLPLRRAIADMRRRAAICLAANARYLGA
jgi:hypothetical protein